MTGHTGGCFLVLEPDWMAKHRWRRGRWNRFRNRKRKRKWKWKWKWKRGTWLNTMVESREQRQKKKYPPTVFFSLFYYGLLFSKWVSVCYSYFDLVLWKGLLLGWRRLLFLALAIAVELFGRQPTINASNLLELVDVVRHGGIGFGCTATTK